MSNGDLLFSTLVEEIEQEKETGVHEALFDWIQEEVNIDQAIILKADRFKLLVAHYADHEFTYSVIGRRKTRENWTQYRSYYFSTDYRLDCYIKSFLHNIKTDIDFVNKLKYD